MLNNLVIGLGQAGNKAVISMVENGTIQDNNYILINSTNKDIPAAYKAKSFIFESSYQGAGKEREIGNALMSNEVSNEESELVKLINSKVLDKDNNFKVKMIILVSSTEGGTGSGASPVLAQYLNEYFNNLEEEEISISIHVIGLLGFESDPKGQENTINWSKELDPESMVIHMIDNKKCLEEANNNFSKAENIANEQVGKTVNVITGKTIVKSDNRNIDDVDLFKIISTPGYMQVLGVNLSNIESTDDFNSRVRDAIKNNKYVTTKPKCNMAGIILNTKPKTLNNVDEEFKTVFAEFGTPYERFPHYEDIGGDNEFVEFIFAGMDMPTKEITKLIERYNAKTEAVDFEEDDSFTNALNSFKSKNQKKKKGATLMKSLNKSTKFKPSKISSVSRITENPIDTKVINTGKEL